jgi:L,D-peptidoglycan transpeptidase YkuD (ErfK/YbiS/YcfS/YnhG family)
LTEFVLRGGFLTGAGLRFRVTTGKAGIAAYKTEGDGATPAGKLRLLRVLYRADRGRAPLCGVPVEPLSPSDGWCDDPEDAAYNRMVRLPYGARHEALWRTDTLYDIIGVLDWNTSPVVKARGSAIFLHIATPDYAPTEGCVALAAADLRQCLAAGLSGIVVA